MTELQHDLPAGMVEWVAEVGGGEAPFGACPFAAAPLAAGLLALVLEAKCGARTLRRPTLIRAAGS